MWNVHPFYWGLVPVGPNFMRMGTSPSKLLIVDRATSVPLQVFTQWFLVEISAKNGKFGYLNPIWGKLGMTHDLGWWLVEKPVVDFLFTLIEISSLSITVPELWGEMFTTQLFLQGVDLFALKFYLDRVVPINHSWHQETRDTGLPDGEDRIPLRSLVLTPNQSVTDRQTDLS